MPLLFGDNRSVVTSATLPHSTLTKRHNILAFHRVREAITAILMAFYWIQSAFNLSDMLSKHWDHPAVYPMILKLLITRGNITLIPREAAQEKEKEILKPQPEKLKKNEKENKNMKQNELTHQPQEGSNRKISMIFPLVSCCSCVNNPSSSQKRLNCLYLALEAID